MLPLPLKTFHLPPPAWWSRFMGQGQWQHLSSRTLLLFNLKRLLISVLILLLICIRIKSKFIYLLGIHLKPTMIFSTIVFILHSNTYEYHTHRKSPSYVVINLYKLSAAPCTRRQELLQGPYKNQAGSQLGHIFFYKFHFYNPT